MELSAKLVRSQLNFFKPFVAGCSLETTRKGQDKLGELMSALHKREVIFRDHDFEQFKGAWVMPKDERRSGVVLYLHGGGYTCGSLDYAKGFAATLASECGVRVFCGAYRLAPENPYPAALEDALTAYDYLLKKGYAPQQILLRERRRRADLRPVPEAEAIGAGAALRAHRHLALGGPDRFREVLRIQPGQRSVPDGGAAAILRQVLYTGPHGPAVFAPAGRPDGLSADADLRRRR